MKTKNIKVLSKMIKNTEKALLYSGSKRQNVEFNIGKLIGEM